MLPRPRELLVDHRGRAWYPTDPLEGQSCHTDALLRRHAGKYTDAGRRQGRRAGETIERKARDVGCDHMGAHCWAHYRGHHVSPCAVRATSPGQEPARRVRLLWNDPGDDGSLRQSVRLSLIHISEPTRIGMISYA